MTPEYVVREKIIVPMQRLWSQPKGTNETDLRFRIEELTKFCSAYPAHRLEQAFKWMSTNYRFQAWPAIAEWKKALDSTQPIVTSNMSYNEMPWIKREKDAKFIFRHSYAQTPLAFEMETLGVYNDYERLMVQMIKSQLKRGEDGHSVVLGDDWVTYLRMKGDRFKAGQKYRDEHATELLQ